MNPQIKSPKFRTQGSCLDGTTGGGSSHRMGNVKAIAESILGEVDWIDSETGFCRCPGEDLHTHANGKRDCKVMLNGAPTIFCLHNSCRSIVDEKCFQVRSAIGKALAGTGTIQPFRPSPEDIQRAQIKREYQKRVAMAEASQAAIFQKYEWDVADMWEESPVRIPDDVSSHWKLLLQLFLQDDVLWIGNDVTDSGPGHERNFRKVSEWLAESSCPGSRICPNTFKPGFISRGNENIKDYRYIVIESDTLTHDQQCSIIRWLMQYMRLRAVVHSGNRSLHAWFSYPSTVIEFDLKNILPAMGIDPAFKRPAQPFRLPGCKRDNGRWQSLLYIDLEAE